MDPELLRLMSEAGLAGPQNELLKAQYIQALKQKATPQPDAMQTRGMTVAASPMANIASTLAQVLGGIDSRSYMDAMSGNLRKQQDFRTKGVEAATQPGADPSQMQYAFAGGGEPGLSGVANAEENRVLKQALLKQQNEARQKQIETTGNFKLTSDALKEQGLTDRWTPFASAGTPSSGIATTHRGTGEVTTQAAVLNPNKPAGGVGGVNPDDPKEIAQAIIEGRRSPLLNRMFRYAGPVAAELAKNHDYNHATAEQEWGAMTKFVASANNAQQLRIRQSIDAAYHQLDNIESIYGKWKEAGAASGIKVFNRAALAASRNLPGEAGVSAHMLEASINDMIEAVANVYMGGNSPTEQAFHLAEANLKSNWNPETFEAGLKLLRTNLKYRDNALKTAGPVGTGGQNQYAPDNTQSGNTAPAKVKKYNPATDSFE
jgi:hypothetical protein